MANTEQTLAFIKGLKQLVAQQVAWRTDDVVKEVEKYALTHIPVDPPELIVLQAECDAFFEAAEDSDEFEIHLRGVLVAARNYALARKIEAWAKGVDSGGTGDATSATARD